MRFSSKILGLPVSLILLVTSHANALVEEDEQTVNERSPLAESWLQEPPAFFSNGQSLIRRKPVGVQKMSDDPGEKFYLHYWQFEDNFAHSTISEVFTAHLRARDEEEEVRLSMNSSAMVAYRLPFALHTDKDSAFQDLESHGKVSIHNAPAALAALEKRAFTCPSGTNSCERIGAPNACCAATETCFNITQDLGLGSVGCCPNGVSCGGTVTTCDSGNTPCLADGEQNGNYVHGGCCIPNYICSGVGCVIDPALIVTVIITQTFTDFPSQVQTSTVLSTLSPSTSTITDTSLQTTLACSTNMHACPVNFGGGCCTSGFACAPSSSCLPPTGFSFPTVTTTTTGTGAGAIRPTTDASSPVSEDIGSCPTGFYACSAFYRGGCCRTGRDCQTTSCPPTSSTTIINGVPTVVVPVDNAATVATPSGVCATGWATCAPSVGGNCCPSGWDCGTASCTSINPSQTAVLQKASPNRARSLGLQSLAAAIAGSVVSVFIAL